MWNWSVTSTAVVFKETVGPLRHIVLIFLLLSPSLWVLSMEQAQCKLHTSPIYNPLHLSLLYIMCCKCAWIHSLSMCLAYHFALVVVVIRSSLCLPLFIFPLMSLLPTVLSVSLLFPLFQKLPQLKLHLVICPSAQPSLSKTASKNTTGVQPGGASCHHRPPITSPRLHGLPMTQRISHPEQPFNYWDK